MRRFFYYAFPLGVLGLFILIMNGTFFLKQPQGRSDDVAYYLEIVKTDVMTSRWSKAAPDAARLQRAFQRVTLRLQFAAEREELERLQIKFARLRGAIAAANQAGGLMEISEAQELWYKLGR